MVKLRHNTTGNTKGVFASPYICDNLLLVIPSVYAHASIVTEKVYCEANV